MVFNIIVLNPVETLFDGRSRSAILPGEAGVFELLPYHKPILSRLISGTITIEDKTIAIRRGIVKFNNNKAVIVVE